MSKLRSFAAAILILTAVSCTTTAPQRSQAEIREFQTRVFDADSKTVLKACLNALQDDGYIVKAASPELGLLSATKQRTVEPRAEEIPLGKVVAAVALFALLGPATEVLVESPNGGGGHRETDVTINVTEFGDQSKVRLTFAVRQLDNLGAVQIPDDKLYQEFFAKIDKAIFLQKQKL